MFDIETITHQVLRNCSISDSRHAGLFSVCGLALRLRDLYKWEKGLEPWVEEDAPLVLEWIGQKEEEWETLEEENFGELGILDTRYDPFDVENINAALEPHGLCYGAGYVHGLRPTFFLAVLEEKREMEGHPISILGRELARDLLTLPAISQGNAILVRKESARLFLWNQIFFLRKSGREALQFALEACGIDGRDPEALKRNLGAISDRELEMYIYHELGEIRDCAFDRDLWRDLVAAFPQTAVELLARTVKDVLADTTEYGRLRFIVKEKGLSSLGLYVAFLDGLRKEILPEVTDAFQEFRRSRSWGVIEEAADSGYRRARDYAETMSSIFRQGKDRNDLRWAHGEIERQLLEPLGLTGGRRVEGDDL